MDSPCRSGPPEGEPPGPRKDRGAAWRGVALRLTVLAVVLVLCGVLYAIFHEQLTLKNLVDREAELRAALQQHPVVFFAAAFVLYVVVTALSLPGAALMSLVYGWLFGFWPALVLISFASTAGATLAFLFSRFLFGELIQRRFGERLKTFNRALEKEGPFFLFTLRLTVGVPFFVINLVMGLTPIRVRTFWWVSQFGMLPGTCVYVFAGSTVPSGKVLLAQGVAGIFSWPLIVAFAILGVFPLVVRYGVKIIKRGGRVKERDGEIEGKRQNEE